LDRNTSSFSPQMELLDGGGEIKGVGPLTNLRVTTLKGRSGYNWPQQRQQGGWVGGKKKDKKTVSGGRPSLYEQKVYKKKDKGGEEDPGRTKKRKGKECPSTAMQKQVFTGQYRHAKPKSIKSQKKTQRFPWCGNGSGKRRGEEETWEEGFLCMTSQKTNNGRLVKEERKIKSEPCPS